MKINRIPCSYFFNIVSNRNHQKPEEDIIEAYEAGQRDFGENYPNELKTKAASAKIAELCPDIRWHFIGTIQKKSLNHILKADKLTGIQTVTSAEVIDMIEKRLNNEVNIMLQVGFRIEKFILEIINFIYKKRHVICRLSA